MAICKVLQCILMQIRAIHFKVANKLSITPSIVNICSSSSFNCTPFVCSKATVYLFTLNATCNCFLGPLDHIQWQQARKTKLLCIALNTMKVVPLLPSGSVHIVKFTNMKPNKQHGKLQPGQSRTLWRQVCA